MIVVPHENESKIIVEDDALDDDLVMPIACCDDYDWEDNDTSYDLENIFGTCLEEYDNNVCYTIGAIHTINDENDYAYDMKRPKLGEAMFDEDEIFENIFAEINVFPILGMLRLMKMIFLASQVLICKVVMMIACLLPMMIILMKVGLEECQL
jgi:hypothetical protein